ncbi:hypothetical protein [Streptomyces palmae]|uniref:Tetratricopeptide repeat protein n=1 Tax=Streptomyces palmae TaxID=1701085 RepID=A0A4Z0HAR1_9ACTN|nr:hypothetical protein [Streptomyces palmae]TGB10828.1 hypothetical protein E4099_12510 [Streptomyces palmae]
MASTDNCDAQNAGRYAGDVVEGQPEYIAYLDHAELSSTLGEVLLFLSRTSGQPRHATSALDLLSTAAAERDCARARSSAFDAIAAARALLVVDDLEAACATGLRAIRIGSHVESVRVRRRFLDLAREAQPHESEPAMRSLREQLLASARP